MTRTASVATSGAALLLLLAACSGSGGSEGGGGACAEYVNALVSFVNRCGDAEGEAFANERARFEAACGRAINAPGASNAAAQVSACARTISSATTCNLEEVDCKITGGTLEDGAACGESHQCKSGGCRVESGSNCGKCAPRSPIGGSCTRSDDCVDDAACLSTNNDGGKCVAIKTAKAGEKCAGDGSEMIRCATGLTCTFGAGDAVCKAPSGDGAECSSSSDCSNDLRCVDKKCAAGLGEGASCTFDECAKGLDCGADNKCARVVYVKGGETCDATHRCAKGSCKGGGVTSGPDGTVVTPGKCVDPLPDGAACTADGPEDAPECDTFAECVDGKCTPTDPAQCK